MNISVQDAKFFQSIEQLLVNHIDVRNQRITDCMNTCLHEVKSFDSFIFGFYKKHLEHSLLSTIYNHVFCYGMLSGHFHALAKNLIW